MIKVIRYLFLNVLIACTLTALNDTNFFERTTDVSLKQTLNCILKFYETYTKTKSMHSGSKIHLNIHQRNSFRTQNLFLKGLSDSQQHFFNSTVVIESATNKPAQTALSDSTKASKYVLFLYDARDTEANVLSWKSSLSWNPLAPVFVVLRAYRFKEELGSEIKIIIDSLRKHDMWRCYVVSTIVEEGYVDILSWFPYKNDSCGKEVENIQLLERCYFGAKNKNKIKAHYNYEKWHKKWALRNLRQCPLKASAAVFAPYIVVVNKTIDDYVVQ